MHRDTVDTSGVGLVPGCACIINSMLMLRPCALSGCQRLMRGAGAAAGPPEATSQSLRHRWTGLAPLMKDKQTLFASKPI